MDDQRLVPHFRAYIRKATLQGELFSFIKLRVQSTTCLLRKMTEFIWDRRIYMLGKTYTAIFVKDISGNILLRTLK